MKSITELKDIRDKAQLDANVRKEKDGYKVAVCMATCGIAAGARNVMSALMSTVAEKNLVDVTVAQTGCIGACKLEPIVEVVDPKGKKTTYVKMDESKMKEVIEKHVIGGEGIAEYMMGNA